MTILSAEMNGEDLIRLINSLLVKIPAGSIKLRDDRIKKTWIIDINEFMLSKHLISQKLFTALTDKKDYTFKSENHPAENVSWLDAIAFCNKLSEVANLQSCYSFKNSDVIFSKNANGYRLPTEAEWEYSCKAGTDDIRYGQLDAIAWYKTNSNASTQDIGTKQANAWGLYDMLGNVWEWCNNIYDEEVYGKYRIIRGGGWFDEARGCLATNRRRSHPSLQIDDLGFRIAKNI